MSQVAWCVLYDALLCAQRDGHRGRRHRVRLRFGVVQLCPRGGCDDCYRLFGTVVPETRSLGAEAHLPFVRKHMYPLCLEHIDLLLEHVPPISEARTIEAIYRRG